MHTLQVDPMTLVRSYDVTVDGRRRWWKPWEHPFNRLAVAARMMGVSQLLDHCHMPAPRIAERHVAFFKPNLAVGVDEQAMWLAKQGYGGASVYDVLAIALLDPELTRDGAVMAFGTLGHTPSKNITISPVVWAAKDGLEMGVYYWGFSTGAQIGEYVLAAVKTEPRPPRRPYGT